MLDDFIARKVKSVCPPPNVVSDTALEQLRPVFDEYLQVRTALMDILTAYNDDQESIANVAPHIKNAANILQNIIEVEMMG